MNLPDRDRLRRLRWRLIDDYGPRADRPATVARLVGGTSVAFSTPYYGNMALGHYGDVMVGNYTPVLVLAGMLLLTVVNATVVAWVVWRLLDLDQHDTWSYRRGAGGGLCIGLLAHLTLGAALVAGVVLFGTGSVPATLIAVAGGTLFVAVASVLFTAGVPILLSIGVGAGLTYCRRRWAEATGFP